MRNLADMPRATRHEANSPGRAIRPRASSKRLSRFLFVAAWRHRLFRSIKRPHRARLTPRHTRLRLRLQKRLTPAPHPRRSSNRLFRRMFVRARPPRMPPSVPRSAAQTRKASGIEVALRFADLRTRERSGRRFKSVKTQCMPHSFSRCRV